jgi:hypothetical protein
MVSIIDIYAANFFSITIKKHSNYLVANSLIFILKAANINVIKGLQQLNTA